MNEEGEGLANGWTLAAPELVDGHMAHVLANSSMRLLLANTSPWQNPAECDFRRIKGV
jgi:hypothetical protein